MLKEILFRVLIGGSVVTAFALLSDVFNPKRFAGLFGAAPSVALATLALTIVEHGKSYAANEARSMMAGAIAFLVYAFSVSHVLIRFKLPLQFVTVGLLVLWFVVVFGVWAVCLR